MIVFYYYKEKRPKNEKYENCEHKIFSIDNK